ncbi:MAG: GDP-mannose 4,6-dehydratase [Candidatus Krumholzibacteriia bacterium]
MARYLVTGAGGFVGPHLLRALQDAGHEVWSTDRFALAGDVRHRICDLTDSEAVRALVDALQPDGVLHLASASSVAQSFEHPQFALQNNLLSACNLFEAVRRSVPRARVLVVGSAEQYGIVRAADLPLREEHPLQPASPYAVSKVAQELLALQYRSSWGTPVILTRSFNHSGPGQSDRFVLPGFARQIAEAEAGRREPVLHVGNLDVERDFLDVRDVARAYVLLMQKGEPGRAYNVCRGESHRLRDLVDALVAHARADVRIEPDPTRMRPADLPVLRGDPARLRASTGWEPRLSMETTLADVLEDWRRRISGGNGQP